MALAAKGGIREAWREHWMLFVTSAIVLLVLPLYLWNDALGMFVLIAAAVLPIGLIALRHPEYLLYAYAFLFPIDGIVSLPGLGALNTILGGVFGLAYVLGKNIRINARAMSPYAWLWLFWACASFIWAQDRDIMYVVNTLQFFLSTLLIADAVSSDRRVLRHVVVAAGLGAAFAASFGVLNFLRGMDASGGQAGPRVAAGDEQSVAQYGLGITVGLLLLLGLSLEAKEKWKIWVFSGLCLFALLGVILSGTRSAWIGIVFAGFLVYRKFPSFNQRLITVSTTFLVLAVVLEITGVFSFFGAVASLLFDRINVAGEREGRSLIWRVSLGIFLEHPILGVGYRSHQAAMDYRAVALAPIPVQGWVSNNTAAHNMYLQMAAELGIVGLAIVLAWLRCLWVEARPKVWDSLRMTVYGLIVAFIICQGFSNVLNRKYWWFMIGMVEGVRYSLVLDRKRQERGEPTSQEEEQATLSPA